ncbi:hypothetical protein LG943_04505 [Streptomonospora sp. S1-112]|uniref:ABC-2 family transporter protein n=1 Tax=Streptomonospora mangrovi TaxID=2883123 RepID=A0A9X3SG13_9ACTN|nr:hypothetical protein [Streptomonospora mangrovi]MDA0563594.1 hypothetical protein [Streptomonospora mangrovi]
MKGVAALLAVACYEARMAARGRGVWIGMVPMAALALLVGMGRLDGAESARLNAGAVAEALTLVVPVGVGVVLADRLRRGTAAGLGDLLDSVPLRGAARIGAVLAGGLAVALLPVLPVTAVLGAAAAVRTGDAAALPWTALAFLVVLLPACAWITALAGVLALVLPAPLARAFVVPAWFWAVAWNPRLLWAPTPVGTLLVPSGEYPAQAWFGTTPSWAGNGQVGWLSPAADGTVTGLANLACVLLSTALLIGGARLIMMGKR